MLAYNLLHVAAFAAAALLLARSFRRHALPPWQAVLLAGIVFCASRFSARFFHALEVGSALEGWAAYVSFGPGASSQYAGLLPMLLVIAGCARLWRIPALALADLCVVPGCIAIALGRVGCHLAGCCAGTRLSALPAWLAPRGLFPAPLAEMAAALAIAAIVTTIPEGAPRGRRAGAFFVLHGSTRFALQFVRAGETYWGPLTTTQVLSLATVALGALLLQAGRRGGDAPLGIAAQRL